MVWPGYLATPQIRHEGWTEWRADVWSFPPSAYIRPRTVYEGTRATFLFVPQVRYRREPLSTRQPPHFPLLEDLMRDGSDGAALLAVIHYYCPEQMKLEGECRGPQPHSATLPLWHLGKGNVHLPASLKPASVWLMLGIKPASCTLMGTQSAEPCLWSLPASYEMWKVSKHQVMGPGQPC